MRSKRREDLEKKAADDLISLIPVYHRTILKHGSGFTGTQVVRFRILHLISRHSDMSISGIGRKIYISKPYMTTIIDTLVKERLVQRKPDPSDRRVIRIRITKRGQGYLNEMTGFLRDTVARKLAILEEEEVSHLCTTLRNLRMVLEKIPEDL